MTAEQMELWQKLRAFAFDPPTATLTFAARLARENGWSDDTARRVVDEYRRFLFLAQTAGHPVSPSEDVDQVWHLHLTYSKSYWDDLCGGVLGQPFHHMPAQGEAGEAQRLRVWYQKTLDSYRRLFAEEPPRDIWPTVDERFAAASFVRVNRRRVWLIPRPRRAAVISTVFAGLVALLATGCGRDVFLAIGGPWDLTGPQFLLLYAALFGATLMIVMIARRLSRGPEPIVWEAGQLPDPYQLAYLAGYGPVAIQAAIASLLQRGHLVFNSSAPWQILPGAPVPANAHWLERDLYDYALDFRSVTYRSIRHSGRLREKMELLDERLVEAGCLLPAGRALWLRTWTAGLFVLLLCFGLSKMHVGLARHRPVEFLVIASIATGIAATASFFWRTRPTRRGRALLRELRERHAEYKRNRVTSAMSGHRVATAVALFGSTVLAGSALAQLPNRFFTYNPQNRGADGSGASCSGGGGGGCGGGGGGCGGGGGGGCGGCGGGG